MTKYQLFIEKVSDFSEGNAEWDEVIALAKEFEPYDTNENYCFPEIQMDCSGNGGRVGRNSWDYCGGCYDGFMSPVSWKAFENLHSSDKFKTLSKEQIDEIYAAIQNISYPLVWDTSTYDEDKKTMHEMDFYMKYEYQFEDYAEAKEWFDAQNNPK